MKFVRISTIVAVTAAIASCTLLFATSQKVQQAENRLAALQKQKSRDQESIRVLRAEWDYLNRPDRLEDLATQYLGMEAPGPGIVAESARSLPEPFMPALPGRKPAFHPVAAVYKQPASPPPAEAPAPSQKAPAKPSSSDRTFEDLIQSFGVESGQ